MKKVDERSKELLRTELAELQQKYRAFQAAHLSLNMARGKPAPSQLDLNQSLLEFPKGYTLRDGTDARNYGILEGIPECRELFGELLDLEPDNILMGGTSSLNLMFDTLAAMCLFGTHGRKPWSYYSYEGTPVKFICPVPGYDRHFTCCEELGIEMIPIPLLEDGPDMKAVKKLVQDPLVKGMWCVPLHSNPSGVCYSDAVVDELASMETAADDFRIFWDNAYGVHHIYEDMKLKNIIKACEAAGNPDRVYYFFSTAKITFPGAGVSLISSSSRNIAELRKHMSAQTISHDKLNQLRHVQYFQTPENIRLHMKKLADLLRPKFDIVLNKLTEGLGDTSYATWSSPKGGYFVSVNTMPGCAKRVVSLAKEAGVVLTGAGATWPYKKDEADSNIRIAPSYPTEDELSKAMDIFVLCVKIAAIEKILG